MKAVVQRAYGEPRDVLEVREIPPPVPKEGEVLVRVRAASMHADIWHVVLGVPRVLRLMGAGLSPKRDAVPGTDASGVVEAVGAGVTRFKPGDEVFGESVKHQWLHGGTYAQLAAMPAARLARKPPALSFDEAGSLATAGLIAWRSLYVEGALAAGQTVLVNGAAGTVGGMAVQIAKAAGARVIGVDLAEKLDVVRRLGADEVIDARAEDFVQRGPVHDIVLDVASTRTFAECRHALKPTGRYVLIGHDRYDPRFRPWIGGIGTFVGLMARAPFTPQIPRTAFEGWDSAAALETLSALAEEGQVRPIVDRAFPLDGTVEALDVLASGRARGRLVIRPG